VYSIGEYNNQLMVGGHFSQAGNVDVNNVASWDGGEWHALGAGITSPNFTQVFALMNLWVICM
jgi:hypothetical protein